MATTSVAQMIESSTSRAVTLYVSHKAWLESVLAGNHGRVDTQNYYTDGRARREEVLSNYEFEDDILYLRSLDPKNWKDQDHYAVLGIRNLRYRANENIIKRAYKYKILKHHPDKRKALGEEIRADDDYFTCITRAWETLGNPVRRKSYDSVDPHFNDSLPDEREARGNFFKVMSKAFIDNSRWSTKQPVPQLGDENTPREIVENFYLFWYDFESWREFSYQDEEDKESGQDRETRKWIEKKNKAVRAKKKKEEMARIRTLVDMAYGLDPRIRKFQQQDKDKKQSVKRAKQEAARERQLEEERVTREAMEEERLVRQKREIEEKAKADQLKVERETQKKALRKERKSFRELCKEQNYFAESPEEIIEHMENVEKICELFKLAQLQDSVKSLRQEGKSAFLRVVSEVTEKIEAERRAALEYDSKNLLPKEVEGDTSPWAETDLQLLIKAVNLFPAGTNKRWEVVANFINQHSLNAAQGIRRDTKEVLAKAKDLQYSDFSRSNLRELANKKAFDNFISEKKPKDGVGKRMPAGTERLDNLVSNDTTSASSAINDRAQVIRESLPWTPAEQKLLEQALKTYPSSASDRWGLVSACIPTRTKKECMKRYKELVELIKSRREAQVLK